MPFPASYIKQFTAPFWNSLTDGQRSSWHFFANDNPIRNNAGELIAVNGWQMFNHVNAWLAVTDNTLMLPDPPTNLTEPEPINLTASVWPIKQKQANGLTARQGRVYLKVLPSLPPVRLVAVVQATEFISEFSLHPWPRSKTSFIPPGFSGLFDLTSTSGFQSSNFAGLLKKRIVGPWASKHPLDRVAKLIVVSTVNGMSTEGSIVNSKAR
jgi:hypothetical protein